MARRTPTEQPTDTPTLHGHYDGPRGRDDEHRHPGGDRPHGHLRADSSLGRVAEPAEYVPAGQLPDARAKMADAARPTVVTAAEARARVAALGDTPTDPGPGELVTRDGNRGSPTDATVASVVHRLAHLAEHDRFANLYSYEIKTLIELSGLLADAETQLADRQLVDVKVIGQLGRLLDGWAMYRKARDGGGS